MKPKTRAPAEVADYRAGVTPLSPKAQRIPPKPVKPKKAHAVAFPSELTVLMRDDGWAGWRPPRTQADASTLMGVGATSATIDLHGLRAHMALTVLDRFLASQVRAGARILLVVHGTGAHRTLAHAVVAALASGKHAKVAAFHSAPARLGGLGATLVLLAP